jgi:hypothetical protein
MLKWIKNFILIPPATDLCDEVKQTDNQGRYALASNQIKNNKIEKNDFFFISLECSSRQDFYFLFLSIKIRNKMKTLNESEYDPLQFSIQPWNGKRFFANKISIWHKIKWMKLILWRFYAVMCDSCSESVRL